MKNLFLLIDAEEELNSAKFYYESRSLGLGSEFITQFDISIFNIQKTPEQWPIYKKNIHKYIMHKFPYTIYYVIETSEIIVIAVAHQKRKPNYWKKRIP